MKWLLEITSLVLFIAVTVTSGKEAGVRNPRLILEYDWPELKKHLQRIPHPMSCSHFYAKKPDGKPSLEKCPENELFDFRTLRCREKMLAKCWNGLLKRDHLKKIKRRFSCPFPWGLYPDVEDCSAFYDCLSGRPYQRKCPSSTFFDKAERTCVKENEVLCADPSDVVEVDYKCPYKWGHFTYEKDCSKFYECLRKVPSLRSCKKHMLFDNLKRECMPMSSVDCGERFNPYEKKTIEHLSTGGTRMTSNGTATGGILETSQFPPATVEVAKDSISTERKGMTGTGVQTVEVTKELISSESNGMMSKGTTTRGIPVTSKFTPTGESAKDRMPIKQDKMTSRGTSSGGILETSKSTETGDASKESMPMKHDKMGTSTGGILETSKFTATGEAAKKLISTESSRMTSTDSSIGGEVTKEQMSTDRKEMMSKSTPKESILETSKFTSTGEVAKERSTTEKDRMTSKRTSTEGILETSTAERITASRGPLEIISTTIGQNAVDERNSKKEGSI